jgi:hypothetical protein
MWGRYHRFSFTLYLLYTWGLWGLGIPQSQSSPVVMANRIIPVPAGNRTPAVQSISSHSLEVSRHIKETMMDDNF